jgi:uncharacterized membrane protein YbhN (UPF0104 family)
LLKWHIILKTTPQRISLKTTIQSLFTGIATGVITPNRIGNFIGRIIFFGGRSRGLLILGTLYSNFSQFLASILFGCLGFYFLQNSIPFYSPLLLIIFIIVFTAFLLFYFFWNKIKFPRSKILKRYTNSIRLFGEVVNPIRIPILALSMMRYLVFSTQYVLLLVAFGVSFSFLLVAAIFLIYFMSTLIPSVFTGKLIIRESASLLILGLFIENQALILLASTLLWIINLGIPSLIGGIILLKTKIKSL